MKGIHIEGPFLGKSPGAHPVAYIIEVDMQWLNWLPSSVRLVTLAAEQRQAVEAIRTLVSRGITVAIGHSQPT